MPENGSDRNRDLENDALKDAAVMNDDGLKYGIPHSVFYAGIAMTVILGVLLRWWTGAAFAAIWFYSMYEIHKDDPRALESWIRAAIGWKVDVKTSGNHKYRKIYFLDTKD